LIGLCAFSFFRSPRRRRVNRGESCKNGSDVDTTLYFLPDSVIIIIVLLFFNHVLHILASCISIYTNKKILLTAMSPWMDLEDLLFADIAQYEYTCVSICRFFQVSGRPFHLNSLLKWCLLLSIFFLSSHSYFCNETRTYMRRFLFISCV